MGGIPQTSRADPGALKGWQMSQQMTDDPIAKHWVIRDANGKPVQMRTAPTRGEAIRLFCHPALLWPPFAEGGWTCGEATEQEIIAARKALGT
jgi:hypothetical protein